MSHADKNLEKIARLKKLIAKQKREIASLKKLMIKDKNGFSQILQETKSYYENIIAKMPGHVYWLDKNNVYLGCNDLQATHVGLKSRNEIIGKTNYDLFPRSQAAVLNRVNTLVMKTGQTYEIEEFAIMNNIPGIYLSQKAPLKNDEGKTIGILGISFDITAKKETETLKTKHAIAEEKAHVMKMLAGSIAHELRTPLASINLYAQNLELVLPQLLQVYSIKENDVTEKKMTAKQLLSIKKIPGIIRRTVEGCAQIINMLLMNIREAKLNRSDFVKHSIKTDVNAAISEYVFEKNQRELIHFNPQHAFHYSGVPLLMKHILYNLIRNALYYIKVAGKGEIYISFLQGTDENQLIFKDTGKGIPEKYIDSIFDRFVTHRHGGTGLGLAFCKMVMLAIEGDISVRSKSGKYTEFILHFPKLK